MIVVITITIITDSVYVKMHFLEVIVQHSQIILLMYLSLGLCHRGILPYISRYQNRLSFNCAGN